MMRKDRDTKRRQGSLSRNRIVEAAIEILDASGEMGLTFQALARKLATGAGAIYWHIDNKGDLLTAACDAVMARTLSSIPDGVSPEDTIRTIALQMFDAVDDHPWIGSALNRSPGQMPVVRLLERVGSQIEALGVPSGKRWTVVSVLLSYIMGVAGQNAANAQFGRASDLDRSTFLSAVADDWSQLDPVEFPFSVSVANPLREHDDRADFLAGIDLILAGIQQKILVGPGGLEPPTKRL